MENNINKRYKSFTSLEQSKKLAEILPLESADMNWHEMPPIRCFVRAFPYKKDNGATEGILPCWSLASLLEQLPYELCDDDGNSVYLQIDKENDVYQLVYTDHYGDFESIETGRYDDFVDACYEMIIKLKENNLL